MRWPSWSFLLLVLGGLACGKDIVIASLEGEPAVVSGYSTFAVVIVSNQGKSVGDIDEAITELLRPVVSRQVIARGFEEVPLEQADLIVAVDFAVQGYSEYRQYQEGTSYGGDALNIPTTSMNKNMNTTSYVDGLLMFDFVNVKAKTVLWRVSTRSRVSQGGAAAQLEVLVSKIVGQLRVLQVAPVGD